MKIKNLTQRTPTSYTFSVGFGPFWVRNWFYNSDQNNVIPPSNYAAGRRYSYVLGYGRDFVQLRTLVTRMVELGWTFYNSDDMLLPEDRHKPSDDKAPVSDEENTYITEFEGDAPNAAPLGPNCDAEVLF